MQFTPIFSAEQPTAIVVAVAVVAAVLEFESELGAHLSFLPPLQKCVRVNMDQCAMERLRVEPFLLLL